MDHVSATNGLTKTERENISGARVFDGEDQGKNKFRNIINLILLNFWLKWNMYIGAGNRYRMQQLQQKDWCEQ